MKSKKITGWAAVMLLARMAVASFMVSIVASASPMVLVTGLGDIPSSAVVIHTNAYNNGLDYEGTTQARYRSASDYKGVTQTITWNSDYNMAGFGFRIAACQTNPALEYAVFDEAQNYQLLMSEVTGGVAGSPTMVDRTVSITPEMVVGGEYLYFSFDPAVEVVNGNQYLMQLRPMAIDSNNRIFVDTAVGTNPYADGFGDQINGDDIYENESLPTYVADDLSFFAADARPPSIDQVFPEIAQIGETMLDPETGHEVVVVTPANWTAGVAYPHARSWSADSRWLFFSAILQLQDTNSPTASGDIHILAADMEQGGIYQLATIPNPAGFPNREIFNQIDIAPEAGRLMYFNRHDNSVHLLNLYTGEEHEVFKHELGELGEPPSISQGGNRLAWFAKFQGPEGYWFYGKTGVIFLLDLDSSENTNGMPRRVYALPSIALHGQSADFNNHVVLSHVQLNPADPDLIAYSRGSYARPDGSVALSRMWSVDTSGYPNKLLAQTPAGHYHTHELWSDDGEWMYFVDTGNLARIPRDGGDIETIASGLSPRALHMSVSRNNRRIAYDGRLPGDIPSSPTDLRNYPVEVWGYDVDSSKATKLVATWNCERFHSHSHPKISPDGSRVSYTFTDGNTVGVAVVTFDAN